MSAEAPENVALRQLEMELQATRKRLQTATAQLESCRKELQAASEKLEVSKAAEARQRHLRDELQHRLKNILFTVTALANRMLASGGSLEEFSRRFRGRLNAMAATHELLSRDDAVGADLQELLRTVLRGQTPLTETVSTEGPDLLLTPAAAATLSLIFYELATNAAKYGALATPLGKVRVSWRNIRLAGGDLVSIEWRELDGPRVPASFVEGFGTRFVKRNAEYELQGTAVAHLESTGLRWTLEFPIKGNIEEK